MQAGDSVKYKTQWLESGNILPNKKMALSRKRGEVIYVRKSGSMYVVSVKWRGQTRNTLVNADQLEVYWRTEPSADPERVGETK